MTVDPPTHPPGWLPPTGQQGWVPSPPPKRRRRGRTVLFVVLGVVGLLVVVGVIGAVAGGGSPRPAGTKLNTPAPSSHAPATTPEATTPAAAPKPGDFHLTVKIRSKQCFGEAGCNVTYRIAVAYGGPPVDPSTTYSVTYAVRGVENGPQINTFTVTGDRYEVDSEEIAQTSSSAVKLTAVATDVTPG